MAPNHHADQPSSEDIPFLWQKYLEGDEAAFDKLYLKLYGKLLCFCNKYTKDEHEADNVVSEIFFKMLRYERPEQIENIEAFLYKMAKKLSDRSKRKRGKPQKTDERSSFLPSTHLPVFC